MGFPKYKIKFFSYLAVLCQLNIGPEIRLEKNLKSNWRLLRVPWTARRSNQSILKEISPECSLEGLMLKLKLHHFGHLTPRVDFIGKDPDAGRDWGQEEKGTTEDEMVAWHHRLDGHESE